MPRGAFTWHIRPLMQLVMCESSADSVERHQLPHRADRIDEFLELLLEPFALAFAIGARWARPK